MVRLSLIVVFSIIILAAFGQAAPKFQQQQAAPSRVDAICKQLGGGC
jgi:hypothetical protein